MGLNKFRFILGSLWMLLACLAEPVVAAETPLAPSVGDLLDAILHSQSRGSLRLERRTLADMREESLPLLEHFLKHGNRDEKLKTLNIVDELGPDATPLIPALRELLVQKDLQGEVLEVLNGIGPSAVLVIHEVHRCLRSEDPNVPILAMGVLCESGPAAAQLFAKDLAGSDSRTRGQAARALQLLGPAGSPARQALAEAISIEDQPEVLGQELVALQALGNASASSIRAVCSRTHRKNPQTLLILQTLSLLSPCGTESQSIYSASLSDPDARVRALAAGCILRCNPENASAAQALTRSLKEISGLSMAGVPDEEVVHAIRVAGVPGENALAELICGNNVTGRSYALYVAGSLYGTRSERLAVALRNVWPHVQGNDRILAIRAMQTCSVKREMLVDGILGHVTSEDPVDVQLAGLQALERLVESSGENVADVQQLASGCLKSSSAAVRKASLRVLSRTPYESPIRMSDLTRMLTDPAAEVRSAALLALAEVQNNSEQLVEMTLPRLKDTDLLVRQTAIGVLEGLSDRARSAIPALWELQDHQNPHLAKSALRAILTIDPGNVRANQIVVERLREKSGNRLSDGEYQEFCLMLASQGCRCPVNAVDVLREGMNGRWQKRVSAAAGMLRTGPETERALAILRQAVQVNGNALFAADALAQAGDAAKAAIPDLMKATGAASPVTRLHAVRALMSIAPQDERVQRRLRELQSDPSPLVREEVGSQIDTK